MFGKSIKLFKILGFEVKVDWSWTIVAVLVVWSLAIGLFPYYYEDLSPSTYWFMGLAGGLGLFLSILFHEFCHSLVARRYGLPMKGITLFIFGGVAEMEDEPPSPRSELVMALAGPVSSIAISLIFYGLHSFGGESGWPPPIKGVLAYLAFINVILAGFNLLPAFPLDGGRVLRSILWGWKGNLQRATRISSSIGVAFGVVLIILAVLRILTGNFVGGMWLFLIGLFLREAARGSYRQLLTRKALEGERVRRFMKTDPITVSPSASVRRLVEDYIYQYHFKMFPVVEEGRLIGCISTREVKETPRQEWERQTVGSLMSRCSTENTVTPDTDALKALALMSRTRVSRLLVVEGDRLVGVLTLKDLLQFLALRIELEEEKG